RREAIRAAGNRFVVAPAAEHVDTTIEHVVDMSSRYWVVEKLDQAAEQGRATIPAPSTALADTSESAGGAKLRSPDYLSSWEGVAPGARVNSGIAGWVEHAWSF